MRRIEARRYPLNATDPDVAIHRDLLSYEIMGSTLTPINPINISDDGVLTWTPTTLEITSAETPHILTIRVDDGRGGTDDIELSITVNPVPVIINSPPLIDSIVQTPSSGIVKPGEHHRVSVNWSGNTDHDKLDFSLVNAPYGMHIDEDTGDVTWVPTDDELGTFTYYIVVDDNRGGVDSIGVKVTAAIPNEEPIFFNEPSEKAYVDRRYYYMPDISDPDGIAGTDGSSSQIIYQVKELEVIGNDPGVDFQIINGVIDFTPTVSGGIYSGIIEAIDQTGAVAEQPFRIEVHDTIGNDHFPVLRNYPAGGSPGVINAEGNEITFTGGVIEVQQGDYFYFRPDTLDYLSATQWTYDSLGRLLTEQFDAIYDGVSFTADQTTSYTYSLTGNQLSKTTDSTGESIAYFYDANDRMTQETGHRHDTGSSVITTTIDYLYGGAAGSYTKTYLTGLSQYETGNSSNNVETTTYSYNLDGRMTGVNSTRYELDGTTNQLVEVHTWYWYAYDHQGMRVSNDYYTVVGGSYEEMACHYLIDENNPTGYTQVLEETITNLNTGAKTLKTYTLGLDVIAQADDTLVGQSGGEAVYLLMYDSHGSTRYLTNSTGGMVAGEIYDYEAYGDLRTGNPGITNNHTVTSHLYTGARFDATVQMYDLRGRFVRTQNGRFPSMDPYAGDIMNPLTLNKYGYCHGDPINGVDPSGMLYSSLIYGIIMHREIGEHYRTKNPSADIDQPIRRILNIKLPWWQGGSLRPDLAKKSAVVGTVYEIKPIGSYGAGQSQLTGYLGVLNTNDNTGRTWMRGWSYVPPSMITIEPGVYAKVFPPVGGVIMYTVLDLKTVLQGIAAYSFAKAGAIATSYVPQIQMAVARATLVSTMSKM